MDTNFATNGRELTYELVLSLLLGMATREGESVSNLHQVLVQQIHKITDTHFFDDAKAQLFVAEAIEALDSVFSLASVVQEKLRP